MFRTHIWFQKEVPELFQVVEDALRAKMTSAIVVGAWWKKKPNQIFLLYRGRRRVHPSSLVLNPDTLFDLASLTKVLATTLLCGVFYEKKWLSLDLKLGEIFPNIAASEVTVFHLLTHSAGFCAWKPFWETIWKQWAPHPLWKINIFERKAAMKSLLWKEKPQNKMGEKVLYSDLSFLLLGFLLETIGKESLLELCKKWIWNPHGIQMFAFPTNGPASKLKQPNVAATEQSKERGGVLEGVVHDQNAWTMGGFGGHAGVFANAENILHLVRVLLEGKILTPKTRDLFWSLRSFSQGTRALGWDVPSGDVPCVGKRFTRWATVGHLGYTGTSLWLDLKKEFAVVLLTNRLHMGDDLSKIRAFRPKVHEAIWNVFFS